MLVLARKIGEKIIINDNVEITILDATQNSVRIGVNAPKSVSVYREELYKDIKLSNKNSNKTSKESLNQLAELLKEQKSAKNSPNIDKLTVKISND